MLSNAKKGRPKVEGPFLKTIEGVKKGAAGRTAPLSRFISVEHGYPPDPVPWGPKSFLRQ
jgi:hypothetical protein